VYPEKQYIQKMEDKNQDTTTLGSDGYGVNTAIGGIHAPPSEYRAISLEPSEQQPLISQVQQLPSRASWFARVARRKDVWITAVLILLSVGVSYKVLSRHAAPSMPTTANSRFNTIQLPLASLISGKDLDLAGAANVTINGSLQLNDGLLIAPTLQPTGAKQGQIYYDQGTNQLAYYNGSQFVFLSGAQNTPGGIQSLGGATGQLTLGSGLVVSNNQLASSGVISVQGQNGDVTFTAGPGMIINGTTFSNNGVISLAAGSPNVALANDGSGNVTISVAQPIAGTGTVTSSGGTAGVVPLFTAGQNIENSIITQSGLTVTISGDLSVVTGGLSLTNALTVSNGGTGVSSLANNGILVGQGTGPITTIASASAGLCLLSTAGLPVWGACPGSAGVTTLNGLSGTLTLANASAAGSTIIIDDATTSSKGIATFNATNFTVSSGAVNTVQNINTGATPTFAGLNTNNVAPLAGLTIGSTSQTLTLQGNATTTLTATNGGNVTSLGFAAPTANVTYQLQTAVAGTYSICTTAGNCATSGAVTSPGGTTNHLAKFNGAQIIGDSIIVDNGTTVSVGGALTVQTNATVTGNIAVNGGSITSTGALNITPSGTLTVGVTGQQLILQGNASTELTATNGGSTTSLTFQTPIASVTYRLPTATAGTYDVCTTAGNCVGSGGGVTTSGGSTNRLAKFTGSQVIGDSSITDDGTNVTTSTNMIIQGGNVAIGVANAQSGSINFARSDSVFIGTLMQGGLTGNHSYVLPDVDGTICLSSGNCSGTGSSNTLQAAYDAGNIITTTNAKDIAFTLADTATDSNFAVNIAANSTGYVAITRAAGVASADPAQLLLLNNANASRTQPVGLKIQSTSAGIATAIDASDPNIVTAVNVGANDIVGTTGNITLTNFGVDGSTGNVTTNGTINGQTISSTAQFTGTVNVTGATTFASNIAVNGGSITSTGALNITPSGTLTVGVTGQQLVLQGSASTVLAATGGGFTTTIGFNGIPTANVTYNFDRTPATGTYTICTTIGNCAGTGGGVTTPGGTTGTIPVFTAAQTLGDSLLSQSSSTVTVNGNLNLVSGNQFQVNGTQISSANLSNDANLAKLNTSQTFTSNMIALQNASNSTNAFNVQNAAGAHILTVDSSNAQLILGASSSLDGKLIFENVSNANTVTILPGTPTANRTLTLPDASGIICTDSGNCAGAGATLQTAYNFSTGGTTPKIKVNSSLGGIDIQDADTPIGANLLNIRASNGAGLGSVIFGVGNTGAVTLQNSTNSTTAFRLLTAGGTAILTGDTTNGQLVVGQSSTLNGAFVFKNASNANAITLTTAAATSNQIITLPNATGTICLTSGNCSGSGSSNTLQAAYDAGNTVTTTDARDVNFAMADTTTDSNFLVNLQCVTTCGTNGRFAVQNGGTDVLTIAPNGGSTIFKNSANAVTALRIQNAAGSTTVLDADTTNGRIGVGNASPGYTLDVTGDINTSTQYRIGGTVICAASGCTPAAGSNNYIQLQASTPGSAQTGNFNITGTGIASTALQAPIFDTASTAVLAIGTTNATAINLNQNTTIASGKTLSVQGTALFKPSSNSTTAFQVQPSASSTSVLDVDTTNSRVGIGLNAPSYALDVVGDINTSTQYRIGGTVICSLSGCTPAAGSNNYVQLQGSTPGTQQTGNFNISGVGIAGTSMQAPLLDAASAGTLSLGTTNATAINLNQNTTLASGKTLTVQGSALFQNASNSTSAFAVQDSSSNSVLSVDTTNDRVGIGQATPTRLLDVAQNSTQTTLPMGLFEQAGTGDATIELRANNNGYYVGNDASLGEFRVGSSALANTYHGGEDFTTDPANFPDNNGTGWTIASPFTSGAAGTMSQIALDFQRISSGTTHFDVAVYTDASGKPGSLLGSSPSTTVTITNSGGHSWNTATLSSSISISASTKYWLVFQTDDAGPTTSYWTDATAPATTVTYYANGGTYGTWPATASFTTSQANFMNGIYGLITTTAQNDTFTNNAFGITSTGLTGINGSLGIGVGTGYLTGNAPSNTPTLYVRGSWNGSEVTDAENVTFTDTFYESNPALVYYLSANSGTQNSAITTTFDITGLPESDGAFAYIFSSVTKGVTSGSRTETVTIQVNGNQVSTITTGTATTAAVGPVDEQYVVMRVNGAWRIMAYGNLSTNNANTTYTVDTADLAEWIHYTGDRPQPGEVLTVGDDRVNASAKKASVPYDPRLIGVVTTTPGQVLGADDGHSVQIALTGRIPVKASLENGPIEPGDYLTSSSTPGLAMKATAAGQIIGTALTAYDGIGDATVMTQLHPGYAVPPNAMTAVSLQGSGAAGLANGAPIASGQNATASASTVVQASNSAEITDLQSKVTALQARIDALADSINTAAITTNSLTVNSSATINNDLTVKGTATVATLTLTGHFITTGTTPQMQLQSAAGANAATASHQANATISGNDTAGVITVTAGDGATAGDLAKVTFAKAFGADPEVFIMAVGRDSAELPLYVDHATTTDFTLGTTTTPQAGKTYVYNYHVLQ